MANDFADWTELTLTFFHRWYGKPIHDLHLVDGDEPLALRHWWSAERAWGRSLTQQNVVLGRDQLFDDRGLTVFYVENQSVVLWGFRSNERDPSVHERVNDEVSDWVDLEVGVAKFLHQVAMFEASFGPHALAGEGMSEADLTLVSANISETRDLVFPGLRIFAGEDVLVAASATPGGPNPVFWVTVACRTPGELARFDGLGLPWSYDSRRDG